jgi:hypothetical protein
MTDNLKHLLGGYATGTLTPEENAALMEAALDDQELFDALADDETLRRYLADPAFRKDLLKATAPRPARVPWIAGLAVAAASLSIGVFWLTHREKEMPVVQMAVVRPSAVEPPVPSPAPKTAVAVRPRKQPTPIPANQVPESILEAVPSQPTQAKAKKEEPVPPPAPVVVNGQLGADALAGAVQSAAPVPKTPPAGATATFAPRSVVRTEALGRMALLPPSIVTGKITDVNATIITVNVGERAGVKIGERLDILHDNTNIGYVIINVTEPEYSVGKYTGEKTPAIGDIAATPKK